MSSEESAKAVKISYAYLLGVLTTSGIPSSKVENARIEELTNVSATTYKVTLSYDVPGSFGFDKIREYKDFEVDTIGEGKVISMTIRKV